jgi:SAM-dependent methyltransferase
MAHSSPDASPWVRRFVSLIPRGRILDLACGSGRHSRVLAALGHSVLAVDRDVVALESLVDAGIETRQFDLEQAGADQASDWPLLPSSFSGVVVTNYLYRPLMDALLASVVPGGLLIYETFAQGNGQFGKPSNPDFLLAPGELLQIVMRAQGWRVIAFEDGYVSTPKTAMIQRICARRGGPEVVPVDVAI